LKQQDALVTILMPLKNCHIPYVHKAIDSVKKQSLPQWYLSIIVEAKDSQRFGKMLQPHLDDQRIRMIHNEGRKLAGAVNTGMRDAKTPFVAILLSDDMWTPDAVATLNLAIQTRPDVDFFHSSRMVIDENDKPISSIYYSCESFKIEDFLRTSPVKHLLCWRVAKALSFGGMDESLHSIGSDDYDFPWMMAEHGAKFLAIRECLYQYRDHRESFRLMTHTPLSIHESGLRSILRKHKASPEAIEKKISTARATYLRQCLYASKFEKWLRETIGSTPRRVYRKKYK
jgi:glycosyltransferase involved in cell wall biosynthesis